MNVYLIGFMGSGKTTIGKHLHQRLQKPFIDTDHWIENYMNMDIPSIFNIKGESCFRTLETIALQNIHFGIIATGGGIVERVKNIQIMKKKGKIIYLCTTFTEITKRLHTDTNRPLWKTSVEDRKQLYNRRCELYENYADHTITTDQKSIEKISDEIIALMKNDFEVFR